MAVKIIIKRRVPKGREVDLLPLLLELRKLATAQAGYISGETLRNMDDPEESLVISTWNSVEDWKDWFSSKQRAEVQEMIDNLLEVDTEYKACLYG